MASERTRLEDCDNLIHNGIQVVPKQVISDILDHFRKTLGAGALHILVAGLSEQIVGHFEDLLEQVILTLVILSLGHYVERHHAKCV